MKTKFKILILFFCLFGFILSQGQIGVNTQPSDTTPTNQQSPTSSPTQPTQQPAQPQVPEVIAEVGQIFPGQIDVTKSKQSLHYIKTGLLQKKYLFIRISTFDKVSTALGLYSNSTRALIHSCQQNQFDACYVPNNLLTANTTYIILLVASDSMKYNIYTYWADLEHIKPNQQIKFMFEETNPTQLFHLEFQDQKEFQQIRIVLKPQASRAQGDNLKIFANIGFANQPTAQKHDYKSIHIWGDGEAIILEKNQLKSQTGISIYIVGHAETVYILECQFLKHTSHTIKVGEIVNDYLAAKKEAAYRLIVPELQNNQGFVIKASSFTGQISADFYYDKQSTKPFQKSPYQYMSDMQYNFVKEDFQNGTKELYMKIKAFDSQATYQISTQTRTNQIASQISENIYQFSVLSKTQALYFYSHIWDNSQFQKLKTFKFDLSMIKIVGQVQLEYYKCNKNTENEQNCKNISDPKFKQYVTKVKVDGTENVGSKIFITLEVEEADYRAVNNVEKRLMIIIVAKNMIDKTNSAYAIQYSNPNQIRLLRQARAFEDKVRYMQKKFYKYINNNPSISQIRIHINQISGLTKIRGTRTNIKQNIGQDILIDKNLPDTIVIKDRLTQPIYIQVYGIVTSLYTISVSALHAEHLVSNSLIMAQDVEYQVKLLPYQHMNIQMHPIQADVTLEYYVEGGAVMLCVVDLGDVCREEKVINSQGQIKIDSSNKRQVRVRIGNFIDSKTLKNNNAQQKQTLNTTLPQIINRVKITLIYHGTKNFHCDQRRINKVYSQNMKANQCIQYHVPIASDFDIMLARSDIGQAVKNIFFLCSQLIQPSLFNGKYLVNVDQIKLVCKDTSQILLQILVGFQNQTVPPSPVTKPTEFKVQYLVSFKNDTITLADGIAYTTYGESQLETALHTFFYEIMDEQRPINIVLYNKKGIQKFYAKITNKTQKYQGFVAQAEAKYSSKNSSYYTNPYINITRDSIADADCGRSCVLVLSVYSTEKPGTAIQFALEVTQNHILLKQDHIRTDFLSKGSVRFYEYESKQGKNTLLFKVSDNNRKCARSIMSKNPFPTGSNYYVKENEGVIVYEKTQKGTFYFAVEAVDDCPYTVSVSESLGKVTKIQYGQFYDIKLEEGKEKFFYMQHISNSTFKIVSLKQYGELVIHANPAQLNKNILKSIEDNQLKTDGFAFKSTYKNTLVVKSDSKDFCFNCYYLIYVKAVQMMEGSIFLGSQSSKIAITEDKILFDEIETKNALTYATFYKVSDGNLQVKVHKGKIAYQMAYSSQKYSKEFPENKKVYHQTYNFTKEEGLYTPIQIRVTALEVPALYSFQLTPSQQSKTFTHKVNPGEHTFIFLEKGATECFEGKLTQKQDELFISADVAEKYLLSNLNLTVKIDDAQTDKFEKDIVGNILSISFKAQQTFLTKPKKYHICMNTQSKSQSVSLFVFQNVNVNLIHSDTEVLVRKQSKFVLYPRNDIILDLFECVGEAQIYYGGNLQNIKAKDSHKLDVLGIPGQSHAIRISQFSTLYIDVIAPMATVLWMPLDEKEERGIGYFKYAIGGLEFSSKFNSIEFKVGGVYALKQTKTKPVNVKYTLFVANSKQLLQQAVMCQKNVKQNLVSATINTQNVGTSSSHTVSVLMDKKRITDTFSENQTLYFNVVADLTLQAPSSKDDEDHEHYRFVYYQQVVPSEVFRQNKVQAMNLSLLIVLAVVSVVGFILISCVFVRCIVPALGKLKNRVLVEEKDDQKDQSIPVPPSSERNQIENNVPAATDEQLK